VALEEPARLGLGVGEKQCCGHDATLDRRKRGGQSSIRTILCRSILSRPRGPRQVSSGNGPTAVAPPSTTTVWPEM
jgi:hypothetical protein